MGIARTLLPVLLACLAIAACGGDDGDGGEDGAANGRATAAEREEAARPGDAQSYRRRANALCVADERAAEAVPEPQTPEGTVTYFRKILAISERSEPRYRALEPPERLARAHADYLATGEEGQRLIRRLIDELEDGGDPPAVLRRALPELTRLVDEGNGQARRLGLEDCVEELSPEGAESPESTF